MDTYITSNLYITGKIDFLIFLITTSLHTEIQIGKKLSNKKILE